MKQILSETQILMYIILHLQKLRCCEHLSSSTNQGKLIHTGNSTIHSQIHKRDSLYFEYEITATARERIYCTIQPVLEMKLTVLIAIECLS